MDRHMFEAVDVALACGMQWDATCPDVKSGALQLEAEEIRGCGSFGALFPTRPVLFH
jgi:hypothetical protein